MSGNNPEIEPIVINLGKQKKKDIKKLLNENSGKLRAEVDEVVSIIKDELQEKFAEHDGPVFIPIVLVYKKKETSTLGILGL